MKEQNNALKEHITTLVQASVDKGNKALEANIKIQSNTLEFFRSRSGQLARSLDDLSDTTRRLDATVRESAQHRQLKTLTFGTTKNDVDIIKSDNRFIKRQLQKVGSDIQQLSDDLTSTQENVVKVSANVDYIKEEFERRQSDEQDGKTNKRHKPTDS